MNSLYKQLLEDINSLGITLDFQLELKSFSKWYLARYYIKPSKIRVYVFDNMSCTLLRSYEDILFSLVHEAIHHLQYKDPSFIRVKGIMHNEQFHKLDNHYKDKANKQGLTERTCFIDKNEILVK